MDDRTAVRRYRIKTLVEAWQLTRENFADVGEWAGVAECWGLDAPKPALHLEVDGKTRLAYLGDWVVRGVTGIFFPVGADAFEATYEQVIGDTSDEEVIRDAMAEAQAHPGRIVTR